MGEYRPTGHPWCSADPGHVPARAARVGSRRSTLGSDRPQTGLLHV